MPNVWKEKNWEEFNERFDFWRENTAYPELIKNFYFIENTEDAPFCVTTARKKRSSLSHWTKELKDLRARFADEKTFKPIYEDISRW